MNRSLDRRPIRLYTDTMQDERNSLTLDDIFGFSEALDYINGRLPEDRRLSMAGFRRHVYDDPDRPGSLFQLEPIAVGQRTFEDGRRAVTRVFTRRMLDAYLGAREYNAGYGVERSVVRPTAAEVAGILSKPEALARINRRLEERGVAHRMTGVAYNSYRSRGKLPHRVVGSAAVYRPQDIDAFVEEWVASWGGAEHPRIGAH